MNHIRRLTALATQVHTRIIERVYNSNTSSLTDKPLSRHTSFGDSVHYEASTYLVIRRFLPALVPGPTDVVFDIGCGMGRVLCVFARMDVQECVGIEVSPELAEIACRNVGNLRGRRAPVRVEVSDAATADYSNGTIYWLFNPFGVATMNAVLNRIEETLVSDPRPVRIAYLNPLYEGAFAARPRLQRVGHVKVWYSKTAVSYWANEQGAELMGKGR